MAGCGITQIKYVARLLGVGWDLVKDAFKADLKRRHKRRPLRTIRYIAVDEFSTHKGHKYMTVVLDLESGEILHAQEGKDAEALAEFLRELKRAKTPLQAIAVDMSEAYEAYPETREEEMGAAINLIDQVGGPTCPGLLGTGRDLSEEPGNTPGALGTSWSGTAWVRRH